VSPYGRTSCSARRSGVRDEARILLIVFLAVEGAKLLGLRGLLAVHAAPLRVVVAPVVVAPTIVLLAADHLQDQLTAQVGFDAS
jgi:hypothetical protein